MNFGLSGKRIIVNPATRLGNPQARKNSLHGLYFKSKTGITKLQFWLIMSQAITGSKQEKTPKTTDEIMIERDRFFDPINSPRYANIVLVEPEMLKI